MFERSSGIPLNPLDQQNYHPNSPVRLMTTKSDQDVASEIKKEIIAAYDPLLAIADKAQDAGMAFQCQIGPNAFGKFVIQDLKVLKVFK